MQYKGYVVTIYGMRFEEYRVKKFLIGCLVFVCLAKAEATPQKVRVLLDWFVNPNHASLFAAQYSGAFARQGIKG